MSTSLVSRSVYSFDASQFLQIKSSDEKQKILYFPHLKNIKASIATGHTMN